MSVFSVIGSIASKIFSVVTTILPLLDVIKQLIPSLREEAEAIENLVARGGTEADDFVDRNRAELTVVREWFSRLRVGAQGMEMTIDSILEAADDDTITPEEIQGIISLLGDAIDNIVAVGETSDSMVEALQKVRNA